MNEIQTLEITSFVSVSKLHRLVKIWESYEDLQRQNGPQNITQKKKKKGGKLKIRSLNLLFLIPVKLEDIGEKGEDFFLSALETDLMLVSGFSVPRSSH